MPTLTLTVGLPGCGKTTWAEEEVRKSKSKIININSDDICASTTGSRKFFKFNDANEQYVTDMQFSAAELASKNEWNIIVSDTNLKQGVRDKWKIWAISHGYDYKEKDFFKEFKPKANSGADLHEYFKIKEFARLCKQRNLLRENSVPEKMIDIMLDKYYYGAMKGIPVSFLHPGGEDCILVDIDGTLAHKGNRDPFDERTVLQDTPDEEVILSILAEAKYTGRKIVIMSGRTEGCRADTEQWLQNWGVTYDALFMRAIGDQRPDDAVKYDLYCKFVAHKYNVKKVYDDRDQVVQMYRKLLQFKVLQVAYGNF